MSYYRSYTLVFHYLYGMRTLSLMTVCVTSINWVSPTFPDYLPLRSAASQPPNQDGDKSADWGKGRSPEKKVAFLLICPNEGGEGLAQIFCQLFTNCKYWANLGMGREGETPAQIFWHIGVQKKWYKLSKLGGRGVDVIWTKSRRTATFFRETFP